ncbi:hypothetical protein [Xanthocytophaga agilis]|uniref:Uncharacterized protein n=1 Tax=Xanthocytophaga agilis TaxID=3048010 RepID=A0AAE3RBU3_9BACT|nr:hypothetical protein [Xanthocytophaga agilis]MDJ1505467.1 hypothetical protein [Xanthocytophaga agilis]
MITWKQLFTDKKQRKTLIILFIVSNGLFVINASYTLYFRESWFDTSKKPLVNAKSISKIEIREGSWKWSDNEWHFSHDAKLTIVDKKEIETFCTTLQSAPAKYIDNIRPIHWLYIYFTQNGEENLSIVLKVNYQDETFIEYNDHTYNGTGIAELIRRQSLSKLEKKNK